MHFLFSMNYSQWEVDIKSFVIMVVRFTWYVCESKSLIQAHMSLIIHSTYAYM